MIEPSPSPFSIVLLGLGACLLVTASLSMGTAWSARTGVVAASVASFGMMVYFLARFSHVWKPAPLLLSTLMFAAVIGVAALFGKSQLLIQSMAVAGILVVTMLCVTFANAEPPNIDVYTLHEQAADALRRGENPYTTGNVLALETHHTGTRETISEYTYPPVALVAYAGSSIVFGDSRMAGAIAIPVAFALVLWFVGRRWTSSDRQGRIATAVVALLIMSPMNYVMVYFGWTEPIALPLFVLAAALWTKRPFVSAILLGLALASKQYFLIAVPLVFFLPDSYRWKRAGIAVFTAVLTFVPFLLWDAGGLFDGVVKHHLTRSPRPDSATLAGVGIHVPTAITVMLAAGIGVLLARRALSSGMVLLSISSTLAVFTFLSVRGFSNSWWLVVALASVAIGFLDGQPDTVEQADSVRVVMPKK